MQRKESVRQTAVEAVALPAALVVVVVVVMGLVPGVVCVEVEPPC